MKNEILKDMQTAKGTTTTREKLLDASVELFSSSGFNSTSIRDIAKRTGMTISNIYYHFGSKEGLLLAILEREMHRIVEDLSRVISTDLEPLERFKLLLKTHFDLLLNTGRKEAEILFLEEEHVARLRKQFQIDLLNIYRKELRNLQSAGYVNYKNLTVLAFHIFGVINWHLRWYKPGGQMSFKQLSDELVNFVLYGISGPRSRAHKRASKSYN